jgi:[ribosomal protein S18]-alanine N-acetyltransferase
MLLPPAPFRLRPMQESDIELVVAIDRLSFPTPTRVKLFYHELQQNDMAHYQVLLEGETLVGFAGYWLIGDEIHISTIAVDPAQRGRQLGELLLLNMLFLAYTHPACLVTLEVRRTNIAARSLYEKYQFALVGERRGYYKDTGEDALLMTVTPLDGRYHHFLTTRQTHLFAHLQSGA